MLGREAGLRAGSAARPAMLRGSFCASPARGSISCARKRSIRSCGDAGRSRRPDSAARLSAGDAEFLDHGASDAGPAHRGFAGGTVVGDLRGRLRPISAGARRSRLGAARLPPRRRAVRVRRRASLPQAWPRRPRRGRAALAARARRSRGAVGVKARDARRAVLQQTALPTPTPLIGANEHRLPGSRAGFIARVNAALRDLGGRGRRRSRRARRGARARRARGLARSGAVGARQAGRQARRGAHVRRLRCAGRWRRGRAVRANVWCSISTIRCGAASSATTGSTASCSGQGSALGEGFWPCRITRDELSRRGIILAVCSKNDEANAWEPFDKHPEMALRRKDIACFVANWNDKAENIRLIARAAQHRPRQPRVPRRQPVRAQPRARGAADGRRARGSRRARARARRARRRRLFRGGRRHRRGPRAHARNMRATPSARRRATQHADLGAYLKSLEMRALWGYFDALNKPAHRPTHQQDQPIQPDDAPLSARPTTTLCCATKTSSACICG